jgi:peptidoglycan hydrolase-like protein with peptidoglycan-binding domain
VKSVKLKSKGTEVKTVQRFLNYWMGSKLDVDGICGAATVAAIKKFQKHYGLTVDGIFGAKSVAKARDLILGWNCIGFAMSVWHNGGGLPIKCNCGVISNEIGEKIARAKTDAEAIKIVQDKMDFNDVTVIRNNGKNVPQTKWQAGDIGLMFDGNTYKHMFFIMGAGKIADSSGRGGDGKNDIAIRSDDNYTARVLIRWTGGKKEEPKPTPTKKKYDGEFPSTELKKTRAQVIEDAIIFAKWIAGDNTFHYGHGKEAHHNGCYFCGTQPKSKKNAGIVDYEHTYCCNPFVGACWAHGGCIPTALRLCRKGTSWDFNKGKGYDKSSLFENLGHPAKSKLEPGDVLCNDKHVVLYIGGGKIAEASGGDDNKKGSSSWNKSIHVATLTDDRYKGFKRVHRLKAGMSATMSISHGEVSDRVKLLQAFLVWYGYNVAADRIFGDKTLVAVKKFQKAAGVTADGIVGPKTIAAMKKAVK